MNRFEELTTLLRADGLEVAADADRGTIDVGTAHRGPPSAMLSSGWIG